MRLYCNKIPIMGKVSAGSLSPLQKPNQDSIIVPISITKKLKDPKAFEVQGDSMQSVNIFSEDIVILEECSKKACKDGDMIIATSGEHFALRELNKEDDTLISKSFSRNHKPINFFDSEIKILGRIKGVLKVSSQKQPSKLISKLPINSIINGDAPSVLKTFPDNSIDLVVTSPPYDKLRDYKGFSIDLDELGTELYRVIKDGGVIGMVMQDQTQNFGKSLTSFKTIINWCDNIGFKLFECPIYRKYGAEGAWWNKRFRVDHEYIPIFVKGERPLFFNKEALKIPSKHGGKVMKGGGTRLTNGVRIETRNIKINLMKCRGTIWEYMTAGDGTRLKHKHPATFPDKLPEDIISCFCPPKGIVLDPMCGSGTTLIAAKKMDKNYIGIDIAAEYCKLSQQRIEEANITGGLFV